MSIAFDGANRIIQLGGGQFSVDAQEIYEAWKEWVLAGNAQFPPAFRSVGGDPLGGGVSAGSYFFLNNVDGWRIRPEAIDHELIVTGNLYGENAALLTFLPTMGDYQVLVRLNTSSLTQQVGGGSGLTPAQDALLTRLLDLAEADEELTPATATLRKRGTATVLLQKNVTGGIITPVELSE